MSFSPKERVLDGHAYTDAGIFHSWYISSLSSKEITSRGFFFAVVLAFLFVAILSTINAARWVGQTFPGFLVTPRLVVANVGQNYWSGVIGGLKYPDKILMANGQSITSLDDLNRVVKAAKVGEPIRFTVAREGKTFEASIPTMRFTWVDLFTTYGMELISAFGYIAIGMIVFVLKPDTAVSWSFLLLCSFLSLYNVTDFDKGSTGFARIYMLAMTFIPAAGLHLSLLFPERKKLLDRLPFFNYLPYLLSVTLFVPLTILYPQDAFRPFYQLSLLYLIVAAIGLFLSTLRSYLKSSSVLARQRAKVILAGAASAFPLPALVHYVSLFGGGNTNLGIVSSFLPIPIVIFPLSIAFAIAKHNLFDVDVYIKRAVGYIIMTAIVALGYFSIQTVTTKFVFQPLFGDYANEVFPIAFALLVVFGFDPINRKIQSMVDRIFFRAKIDYKETVHSVSNALASLLNLDQILARVVDTLRKEMFIDAVGLFVLEPQKAACRHYFDSDDLMTAENGRHEVAVQPDDPLLALLSREKKLVTKYDIAEDPRYAAQQVTCGESFNRVAGSLAVPLIYQGEVTGVLTLGHKKSGHFYTREDIDLLDTLADEAAVAIENARLAEQMKKEATVRTNLSRYLSPQIVDQIVKNDVQVNLGGDKKVVTVLFSDIRNFTTITESRKPDELVQQLNEYFTEMAGIIFECGGSLDKYIGDAIVAVFGSLIDLDNSSRSAALAALKMMQRLPALNERWVEKYGLKMEFGIGLNTGEVFLGNIGSPERMEFTVIGDTVNVASRFSGLAKPGQILMTREAIDAFGPGVKCNTLPPAEVKGKTGKLEVFELIGIE
jgi:class 3 adenylate cyclase